MKDLYLLNEGSDEVLVYLSKSNQAIWFISKEPKGSERSELITCFISEFKNIVDSLPDDPKEISFKVKFYFNGRRLTKDKALELYKRISS